jgi:hypothetical protein
VRDLKFCKTEPATHRFMYSHGLRIHCSRAQKRSFWAVQLLPRCSSRAKDVPCTSLAVQLLPRCSSRARDVQGTSLAVQQHSETCRMASRQDILQRALAAMLCADTATHTRPRHRPRPPCFSCNRLSWPRC